MESSLYRYILKHSYNGQVVLIVLSLLSLPIIYITLDLPKKIVNMLEGLEKDEVVTAILPVKEFTDTEFIMMVTGRGTIKRTALTNFSRPRANGIIAVDLDEGDSLVRAILTDGERQRNHANRNIDSCPLVDSGRASWTNPCASQHCY